MKLEKILNSGLGIVLALLVFLAAGRTVRVLSWSLARTCGTLILGGIAFKCLDDYKKQMRQGINPIFKAKDIGLKQKTDYWN